MDKDLEHWLKGVWSKQTERLTKRNIKTLSDLHINSFDELLCLQNWEPLEILGEAGSLLKGAVSSLHFVQERNNDCFLKSLDNAVDKFRFTVQPQREAYLRGIEVSDEYLRQAEAKAQQEPLGTPLNLDQRWAIALYTTGKLNDMYSFYRLHNKALRNREGKLEIHYPFMYLLESALSLLPSQKGTYYRGLTSISEPAKFKKGKDLCFSSIVSASENRDLAELFAYLPNPSNTHVLFEMEFCDGKDIQEYSVMPEREVVATYCSCWKVTDETWDGNLLILRLKQIPSQPIFSTHNQNTGIDTIRHLDNRCMDRDFSDSKKKQILLDYFLRLDARARQYLELVLPDFTEENIQKFDPWNYWKELCGCQAKLVELEAEYRYYDIHEGWDISRNFTKSNLTSIEAIAEVNLKELGFTDLSIHHLTRSRTGSAMYEKALALVKQTSAENISNSVALGQLVINELRNIYGIRFSSALKIRFRSALSCLPNVKLTTFSTALAISSVAVQAGIRLYQWYSGDLTGKQFWKSMTAAVAGTLTGIAASTISLSVGIAATISGPISLTAAGLIFFGVSLSIYATTTWTTEWVQKMLDAFFPDGPEETMLAKRKYLEDALKCLNCTVHTPFDQVRLSYLNMCLKYDPDKPGGDAVKLLEISVAWEAFKNYRDHLEECYDEIGVGDITDLKALEREWTERIVPSGLRSKDVEKRKRTEYCYETIQKHLIYSSVQKSWLRVKLNGSPFQKNILKFIAL